MDQNLQKAYVSGVGRIAAWADLLDNINVFPVADGDTGRNLIISLTPLRQLDNSRENVIRQLLMSARGNSGNIAARFFSGFLTADSSEMLPESARKGRDRAWQAVADPKPGTMLTVFDALAEILEVLPVRGLTTETLIEGNNKYVSAVTDHLENAVRSTAEILPVLKNAGVVDSGALGMFLYLEVFFKSLVGNTEAFRPVTAIFKNRLRISSSFTKKMERGYCVDTVIRSGDSSEETIKKLSEYESVVVIADKGCLKVHLHAADKEEARKRIESLGDVVRWSEDHLGSQTENFSGQKASGVVHIMTDAAGSVTRKDSHQLGITLLDSYIIAGDRSLPETLFTPSELYQSMRDGVKVSTSQASLFERHQYYQRILDQYENALYLCVGSAFTKNYDVVINWKQKNDPDNRLSVIDTGAASGRLGVIAIATARYSCQTGDTDAVIKYAKRAIDKCEEYLFPDRLQYLAAGGRLSKTGAFFGDMLHIKPVVSPTPEGAKKVGIVRNQDEQVRFAIQRLETSLEKDSAPFIMLEYSDNRAWVDDMVRKEMETHYPFANILVQPLSLTSGVHLGPGTWGMAFLPAEGPGS